MHSSAVSYDSTAVRPGWDSLPAGVRDAVAARLSGGPLTSGPPAGGGFTRGFAGVVAGAAGTKFIKASNQEIISRSYRREALINPRLPAGIPVPRLDWSLELDGWVVLAFDAVPGARMPAQPWRREELDATLRAWDEVASALASPPQALLDVGLLTAEADAGAAFSAWRHEAAGSLRMKLPRWLPRDLVVPLAWLEDAWPAATAGTAVAHADLRQDNVVLDSAGQPWFCDWNWPCLAASWFDLATLLVTASGDGYDASALFAAQPSARDAAPEQLDALLAAISGYWLAASAESPVPSASPMLRQHQRWSGETALRWLARRRGWRLP
ncbi:hypothetical protein [Longispora albida]|uniref:hypothetical protein n=1 Tax=Longispora albida TaxID=203523 RepID=UPI0003767EBC|nr:hypothetical protein [Longispora albida]